MGGGAASVFETDFCGFNAVIERYGVYGLLMGPRAAGPPITVPLLRPNLALFVRPILRAPYAASKPTYFEKFRKNRVEIALQVCYRVNPTGPDIFSMFGRQTIASSERQGIRRRISLPSGWLPSGGNVVFDAGECPLDEFDAFASA